MDPLSAIMLLMMSIHPGPAVHRVVGTFGTAEIHRGEELIAALANAELSADGWLRTGDSSGAVLATSPSASLFVGENSSIAAGVDVATDRLIIAVGTGEIRLTAPAATHSEIRTMVAAAVADETVTIHCHVTPDRVRFAVERGNCQVVPRRRTLSGRGLDLTAPVAFSQTEGLTLHAGESIVVTANGMGSVTAFDPSEWGVNATSFLASMRAGGGARLARSAGDFGMPEAPRLAGPRRPVSENGNTPSQIAIGGPYLGLGTSLAATSADSFGAASLNANQETSSGRLSSGFGTLNAGSAFPGPIHLITGQRDYAFDGVLLDPQDMFPSTPEYWSIGTGNLPTGQIVTDIMTGTSVNGSNAAPRAIAIPGFDAYIVHLDTYNVVDPALNANAMASINGVTGFVGNDPSAPGVVGATPLADGRAKINHTATFALGEFLVRVQGGVPVLSMRRSDQDRRIVKDSGGNDNLDEVTVNPDLREYNIAADPRFLPAVHNVMVPGTGPDTLRNGPNFSRSDLLRKAGFTVLAAESLQDYSQRSGQTRFVMDGQIVDISGYKP